jgi:hypothetical protein
VAISIRARVINPIHKGQYLICLRDPNNTMIWSKLSYDLTLDPGPLTFVHEFGSLPLAPGVYTWEIHVGDGHGWFDFVLAPELSIVSRDDSPLGGHFKGFLNLASALHLQVDDPALDRNSILVEAPSARP